MATHRAFADLVTGAGLDSGSDVVVAASLALMGRTAAVDRIAAAPAGTGRLAGGNRATRGAGTGSP